jgi:hypothetical protein
MRFTKGRYLGLVQLISAGFDFGDRGRTPGMTHWRPIKYRAIHENREACVSGMRGSSCGSVNRNVVFPRSSSAPFHPRPPPPAALVTNVLSSQPAEESNHQWHPLQSQPPPLFTCQTGYAGRTTHATTVEDPRRPATATQSMKLHAARLGLSLTRPHLLVSSWSLEEDLALTISTCRRQSRTIAMLLLRQDEEEMLGESILEKTSVVVRARHRWTRVCS